MRRWLSTICAGVLTASIMGCSSGAVGRLFSGGKKAVEGTTAIDGGLSALTKIASGCFVLGAICTVVCIAGATLLGTGTAILRRTAAALIGTGIGALILNVAYAKYGWICGILAVAVGLVACVGYAWGHRNWLERSFNVDLDRDGDIGKDHDPYAETAAAPGGNGKPA